MTSAEAISYWRSQSEVGSHDVDESDPWALPLIVRAEKNPYTAEHLGSITAAAQATVRLLADVRSTPEGEWFDPLSRWRASRIRKVARRGRGIRWAEASAQPGVTVEVGGSEVRALLPHPVSDPPPSVKKMQVGGLELPLEVVAQSAVPGELHIVGAPGVELSTGKACAQAAHAAQLALEQLDEEAVFAWAEGGFGITVSGFGGSQVGARWDELISGRVPAVVVQDGGFTEVAPGTVTCASYF